MDEIAKIYFSVSADEVIKAMHSDAEKGLDEQEVKSRLEKYGYNVLAKKKQRSIVEIFLSQFLSPIVWVLIVAALLAFIFREYLEGFAVVAVIVINALIGFFMELQATRSMEKLRNLAKARSKVYRNGKRIEIDSEELVPGDLLYLEAGDMVTADARIIMQQNLAVKEAALTGESAQVEKDIEPLPEDTVVADRRNSVFKGTVITRGKAKAVIVSTGEDTELGHIAELVREAEKEATPLDKKLKVLSRNLIGLTLVLTGLILLSGILTGKDWFLMVETAIALAVASIPEGLPVISTISLARGMLKLAEKNVIVKSLKAVQTLGETEVILTDKTGTLTENEMYVKTIVLADMVEYSFQKETYPKLQENPDFKLLMQIGILCNDSNYSVTDGIENSSGDPLEIALLRMADYMSENYAENEKRNKRIAEVPFESENKLMGTVNEWDGKFIICVKGATESVLERSVKLVVNGKIGELANSDEWIKKVDEISAKGLRVLSFAYRILERKPEEKDFMHDLVFVGIAGFLDPARPDVKTSIDSCKKAGIKVVMVTGDHPGTASSIAEETGLVVSARDARVMHGKELIKEKDLSEVQRKKMIDTEVFARVNPEQKLDLISVYQQENIVVGMTGDGVNDAPALKKADIGIAMGIRGTEVAKEAADLILKDDAFPSIVVAIKQGRAIFENIRTFVVYLLSCNLSEILIIAVASFLSMPLPLLPLQILFLNMITDVFPALALGMSDGEKNIMEKKPRKPSEPIVTNSLWIAIIVYGFCLTIGVIGVEIFSIYYLNLNQAQINNVTFLTLILAQLWNVFNLPGARVSFFKNQVTTNKFIWIAIILCLGIVVITYLIPVVRDALAIIPLDGYLLIVVFVASLIPVGIVQLLKRVFKIIK